MAATTPASETIPGAGAGAVPGTGVDVVTYEVVRNRLTAIVAQQSVVLKNVSGSPLVSDANDCNTGIYLPDGEIVSMGPHHNFHSGSMELVVANIVAGCEDDPGIEDGDVFITNDPYSGALHMPDVTMLEPVFFEGERVAWVGACAHVLDVGGMTPSSWNPDATEIYQEGLILPPTKLVARGKTRSDVWRLILAASRLPANVGLDLKAMIAANTHGKRGLLRLIDRYGIDTIRSVMSTMLDRSEEQVRERLRSLPDGTFRARNYFDHDGHTTRVSRVEVELAKQGDSLTFDYSRSSEQTNGFFNCTLSGLRGGVLGAVLPRLCHDIPWNSGVMRAIRSVAPEGLVINAKHPAPCSAATVGGSFMVQNIAGIALSQLLSTDEKLREDATAGTTGSLTVFHLGGINQYGEGYGGVPTELLAGGGGATASANGNNYAGPHEILSYQFTNVEGDEAVYPLLYLSRFANTDSGGAGRFRGGVSGGSAFTVHDAPFLHGVLVGHSFGMPATAGLHGGLPGSTHQVQVVRGSDVDDALDGGRGPVRAQDLQGEVVEYESSPGHMALAPGDVLQWSWHGGGGWGDSLDAAPDSVAADVALGLLSADAAERHYGVVITDDVLDQPATERTRARIRAERRQWAQELPAPEVEPVEGSARRIGERLSVLESADGGHWYGCDCGHVLAPAAENWKRYAGHATLTAEDLGAKVRLHPDFTAEAYACPGCGGRLAVEVRWTVDAPLHDVELSLGGSR